MRPLEFRALALIPDWAWSTAGIPSDKNEIIGYDLFQEQTRLGGTGRLTSAHVYTSGEYSVIYAAVTFRKTTADLYS